MDVGGCESEEALVSSDELELIMGGFSLRMVNSDTDSNRQNRIYDNCNLIQFFTGGTSHRPYGTVLFGPC